MGVWFRSMREEDLADIDEIERQAYDFPWSTSVFRDCMRARYACILADSDDGLRAYAVMSMAAGEAHVLNLCVKPECQGQGEGRRILDHLIETAFENDVDTMFLEVRPSNPAALTLYHDAGFNQIGVRQDYYPSYEGCEDALVLARALTR